jgi:hypothetical protein
MFRLIALAVAFMAIVSCAYMVSHEKAVDSLGKARSCCESIAQFRYDQLTEGKGVKFNLNETSDAFTFETGKSYFKAFRLPDKAVPYGLRIRSFAMGGQLDQAHIFYPQIALLDEHFAIIRQSNARDFLLSKAGWAETTSHNYNVINGGLKLKLEGYARVEDPGVKYVLIFTTQELMSTTSPYEVLGWYQVFMPIYGGMLVSIPKGREIIDIQHSPFGMLNLEIVATIPAICRDGGEKDIKPKSFYQTLPNPTK